LRRARKGLATRRVSKLQIVRLLAQCAPLQDRSASVVAQAKQH
jgi:hypothetical protein